MTKYFFNNPNTCPTSAAFAEDNNSCFFFNIAVIMGTIIVSIFSFVLSVINVISVVVVDIIDVIIVFCRRKYSRLKYS